MRHDVVKTGPGKRGTKQFMACGLMRVVYFGKEEETAAADKADPDYCAKCKRATGLKRAGVIT
jgi:hypothetical protein